jgi:hypothetical protein
MVNILADNLENRIATPFFENKLLKPSLEISFCSY